jgi:uncharacterized membrane protein YdcZ (DUF606 family)
VRGGNLSYLVFALLGGAMLPSQLGVSAQLVDWVGGSARAVLVVFVGRAERGRASDGLDETAGS